MTTAHIETDTGWLTPAEAAAVLGVTTRTLARLHEQGRLPAQRLDGGHRRYRRADVEALLSVERAS